MTIKLGVPESKGTQPRIAIVGVGGGGCNAVHAMVLGEIPGVEFVAADTDTQVLARTSADCRISLGSEVTGGYGAGTDPIIGKKAAEESVDEIRAALSGVSLAFVSAGMGGGTGTGALPVIARIAREMGVLAVGVVTKPFEYEGPARMEAAMRGIGECADGLDTLLVVSNQNLFTDTTRTYRIRDAFQMVDDVLLNAVRGVVDLVVRPGIINMDFADLCMVLREGGTAVIGTGDAEGEDRGAQAAAQAANNPLLDGVSVDGAASLLINVTGGEDLGLDDVDAAANYLGLQARTDARIKVGASSDPSMEGRIRVYLVASGVSVGVARSLNGDKFLHEILKDHSGNQKWKSKMPSQGISPQVPTGSRRPPAKKPPGQPPERTVRSQVPPRRAVREKESRSTWNDEVAMNARSIRTEIAERMARTAKSNGGGRLSEQRPPLRVRSRQDYVKGSGGSNSVVAIGARILMQSPKRAAGNGGSNQREAENVSRIREATPRGRGLISRMLASK